MAASENQEGGGTLTNFDDFEGWLKRLDCADLPRILPLAYFGVAFWNHALYGSREYRAREEAIHRVLHPGIVFNYAEYCQSHGIDPAQPLDRKWRNAKCDVQMMWSHVHAANDIFVTEDRRFHSKRDELLGLGAGEIVTPLQAIAGFGLF
jgi:hypothetical protein